VESRGKTKIVNYNTNEYCDTEWKERTWSGKNMHCYEAYVKNPQGVPKYKIWGNYTEDIFMLDLTDPLAQP
jgi:hypothetical protein